MPVGEPAGRALEADAVPIAVELARQLKRPVQITLSQSESQKHDRAAPGRARPNDRASGRKRNHRRVADAHRNRRRARLRARPAQRHGCAGQVRTQPRSTAPFRPMEFRMCGSRRCTRPSPSPPATCAAHPQRELTFFTESFIDELARAGGMEPLAFRMSMLGGNGRLARCLQGAARLAEWDGGGPGSTMGIAGCSAFGSHIGARRDARASASDQRIKVAPARRGRRLRALRQLGTGQAADRKRSDLGAGAGDRRRAGMDRRNAARAAAFFGIGVAAASATRRRSSSSSCRAAIRQAVSAASATTVLAPAVANAIYAGSGKRMRSLPFDPMAAA